VLVHSRLGRVTAWLLFMVLFIPIFGFPLFTVLLMGVAKDWNSMLPSSLTLSHLVDAMQDEGRVTLLTSLETALIASAVALVVGTWGALAAHRSSGRFRMVIDGAFLVPIAVPSVVVGLGLLVGFSHEPFRINGLPLLVVLAHVVLVMAFTYSSVMSSLARIDPAFAQVAASLGARPGYVLRRVTLPLLTPALIAGAGLSFALSMGELGATIMVYPANFETQPVKIFQITDKSADFIAGGAYTTVLLAATVVVLGALSLIRSRAAQR
jgi:2-aminoethylphosphonate transport system permease protein